jgi:hypothetical protein
MNIDTPTKELLFTTVRILNEAGGTSIVGTGFLMRKSAGNGQSHCFMMTNKHVLSDAERLTLGFIARDATTEGRPKLGEPVNYVWQVSSHDWIGHPDPDVDVALLPMEGVINSLANRIYYCTIPVTLMPSNDDDLFIDAIEEITFVGYPNGHRDPAHLTPIVRRGISATPLALPFGNKPSFLVDGSVFGGSSGSPVFLLNEGFYRTGPTDVSVGNRLVLIGIIAATTVRETLLPLVVGQGPHVRVAQELNLGVAYNWHAIEETIAELDRKRHSLTSTTM